MSTQTEKLVVELEAKVDAFNRDMTKAQRTQSESIKNINGRMSEYDKQAQNSTNASGKFKLGLIAVGVAAAAAGAKLVSYLTDSIKVASEFNATVSELGSITGATGEDLEFLAEASKYFGATTTLSASQAANAFKLIASAKPDLLENRDALAAVTKSAITLAEAARMELAPAADALGNAMNQFGADASEADRFINVLAAGSRLGSSAITDTSEALKNAGVAANAAGLSFEETNASIQTLAAVGLKGSEAGTALRAVLTKLDTATDKSLRPSVVGLNTALDNLGKKNLDTTQLVKFFGAEHQSAARILMENRTQVNELTTALTDTNTAYVQAANNTDNFAGDMKGLSSATEGLKIELGNMLIETLDLRGGTQSLTESIQEFISAGGGIETLKEILQNLRYAFEDFYDVMSVYAEQWMKVFNDVGEALSDLTGNFGGEISYMMDFLSSLWQFVQNTFVSLPATIAASVTSAISGVKIMVGEMALSILGLVENMQELPLVGDEIKEAMGGTADSIREFINEQIEGEKELIDLAWQKRDETVDAAVSELEAKREAREEEREKIAEEDEEDLERRKEHQEKIREIEGDSKTVKEKEEKKSKTTKKKEDDKEVKEEKKTWQDKTKDYLGTLQEQTSAASGASETIHKINQGAAAAQTLMSTPAAVMKAYEQLGPIGGSIAAAGIIATGLQSLNTIRSITSDGGGGTASSGNVDTAAAEAANEEAYGASIETSSSVTNGSSTNNTNATFTATNTDELGNAIVGWINSAIKKGDVEIG